MRNRHRLPEPVHARAIFAFFPVDGLSLLAQAREKCTAGVREPAGRHAHGIKRSAIIACQKVLDHRGLGLLPGWNADGRCGAVRCAGLVGIFGFGRASHATRPTGGGLLFRLISHQVVLHCRSNTLLLPPPEALPVVPVRAAARYPDRDSHEDQCLLFPGSPMETAPREKLRLDFGGRSGRGREMDDDNSDLIAQLCTRIGMTMEDASVVALTVAGMHRDERRAALVEPPRRPTLAHHVHRNAPMGSWVLINGTWYQQLKEELGLAPFEGRSWTGLHRHALMSMMAYAFLQSRRLAQAGRKKKSPRSASPTHLAGSAPGHP